MASATPLRRLGSLQISTGRSDPGSSLVPGRQEVIDKLLLRVRASVDFSRAELRYLNRRRDRHACGPLSAALPAIAPFKHVRSFEPPSTCAMSSRFTKKSLVVPPAL